MRVLTPLNKFRACRDNLSVATGAMEVRGGNGYIEEWVNPRLVRDAQIGVLWEGTSNINALDVIGRAVGRAAAHKALEAILNARLREMVGLPKPFVSNLATALKRATTFAERVAVDDDEAQTRRATSALYHAASAVVLAWEASRNPADARRVLLSHLVLQHRLAPTDPLDADANEADPSIITALLEGAPVPLASTASLLQSWGRSGRGLTRI